LQGLSRLFFTPAGRPLGVSLHSYRRAWAQRAKACGYPQRFAQEALGHSSRAVHKAYATGATVICPALDEYESPDPGKLIALPLRANWPPPSNATPAKREFRHRVIRHPRFCALTTVREQSTDSPSKGNLPRAKRPSDNLKVAGSHPAPVTTFNYPQVSPHPRFDSDESRHGQSPLPRRVP
jgi:hypothetical protein